MSITPLDGLAGLDGLEVRNLRLVHRGRTLIPDLSFRAEPGRMLAVCGPSGSGKTSLLNAIAGLMPRTGGLVRFDGSDLDGQLEAPRRVGLVLQGYGLVAVLTAQENVEIVLQAKGLPPDTVADVAMGCLERMQLGRLGDRLVDRLSGGQQQRVGIARALAQQPALLLADEPTSELDEMTRDHVLAELRREADGGAVVVLATHDPEVVRHCDSTLDLPAHVS